MSWMRCQLCRKPVVAFSASTQAAAHDLGANLALDRFYFLGSGIRYGLACEANLKMKEMTLTHSEAFHFLEFRHGPMSMVNSETAVIGLLSDANRVHEMAVLERNEGASAPPPSASQKPMQTFPSQAACLSPPARFSICPACS